MRRRDFALALAALPHLKAAGDEWSPMQAILGRIKPPVFAKRDFPITKFGAKGDGQTNNTIAFKQAIDACATAGGGRVVVPPGKFLTGAIHLKSNVNLHVEEGATVLFSQDPSQYLPVVFTRWEGVECMNYSPFIYAFGQQNIGITGKGLLDGQCDETHWWPWKGRAPRGSTPSPENQAPARKQLFDMGDADVPVKERIFGAGSYLRPNFIQPYNCRNVVIEDVTIRNSPMWEINPVLCRNVTVRGVHVDSHGPNNDGCDPESCTDVLIKDCYFDTGDDCIAIKSGRNRDGRRVNAPTENVIVQNCVMKDGHGGVTLGSEASGGIRNVFVEDCRMDSPHLDRALRLKTNSVRGGFLENIFMRNITAGQVAGAVIDVDLYYEEGKSGKFFPVVRNIHVQNLTCKKSQRALNLRGYEEAQIVGVHLKDCVFETAARPNVVENVKDLTMENVSINGIRNVKA